ncbi:DUF4917 family protein [Sporanaerobacter sp. PP17-6a]|uniref:DUF4917 family protein n=1 Tax=Sporanaerobacter sp. PP17-6a TaxID=1891289 RepID=UPI0008A00659|nr:DUF4917 family protein [Sporanaerobacter sp. PP17-6a]SCL85446.1 hypothetical protein PP176A_0865 [Sporanaerobacter sp. PP17-6a]
MYQIFNFDDLFKDQNNLRDASVILGNGASIAVDDCFKYNNLFEQACKDSILNQTSKSLFKALKTNDFELVMNKLRQACIVNKVLNLDSEKVAMKTYDNIRSSLIEAVEETHVNYNDVKEQIKNISNFLGKFSTVISLNYDLLVYWAIIESNKEKHCKMKDCFCNDTADNGDLEFRYDINELSKPNNEGIKPTLVFYPHGNLILASNENNNDVKIKVNKHNNLLYEINSKWEQNYVPRFVSAGDSEQKLKSIRGSTYLKFVYENILPNLGEKVIIYGWKMAKQDQHLVKKIFNEGNIKEVYISIYIKNRNNCHEEQDRIINCLKKERENIDIKFFDAKSKNCWCY